jgi:LAGLIDADG-like domain
MKMTRRLTNLERDAIKFLVSKETPIRLISRKLKLPLSTTYYHVRKVSSDFRLLKKPVLNFSCDEDLGETLGVFSGDGSLTSKYYYEVVITIGKNEEIYLKRLVVFLTDVFSKSPWLYDDANEGVVRIRYRSKLLFNFFKEYLIWKDKKTQNVHLRQRIKNRFFAIGFLRGLIDTDGYVRSNRIVFNTISESLMKDIEFYLELLKISFRTRLQKDKRKNQSNIYRIEIRRPHIYKFFETIKPKNGIVV